MELQKALFEPTLVRSAPHIVRWWESRRLFYNIVVGTTGLGTLAVGALASVVSKGQIQGPPWQLPFVYGIAANIFFTFGWGIELVVERWMKRPIYGFGPALFRHGLVFAIGLTALPAVMMMFGAIMSRIFG